MTLVIQSSQVVSCDGCNVSEVQHKLNSEVVHDLSRNERNVVGNKRQWNALIIDFARRCHHHPDGDTRGHSWILQMQLHKNANRRAYGEVESSKYDGVINEFAILNNTIDCG